VFEVDIMGWSPASVIALILDAQEMGKTRHIGISGLGSFPWEQGVASPASLR
jgi:hypothetical protein